MFDLRTRGDCTTPEGKAKLLISCACLGLCFRVCKKLVFSLCSSIVICNKMDKYGLLCCLFNMPDRDIETLDPAYAMSRIF